MDNKARIELVTTKAKEAVLAAARAEGVAQYWDGLNGTRESANEAIAWAHAWIDELADRARRA